MAIITERGRWANSTVDERGRKVFGKVDERGRVVFTLGAGGPINLSVSLSDTVTATDSLGKQTSKQLSDSITMTDTITTTTQHLLSVVLNDTISVTDSLVKSVSRKLTDSISVTDTVTTNKRAYLTLMDLVSLMDAIGVKGGGPVVQTIKIKRGVEANLPTLAVGEPALTTDTHKLFIGTSSGNVEFPTLMVVTSTANLPTASASNQFMLAGVKGGAGVADAMYMCKKLSNDTYDWVQFV